MPVKYKLSDLASIFCGHTFRGKIQSEANGEVFVVQPQNIEQYEPQFKTSPCRVKYKDKGIQKVQHLQNGDILFLAKSTRMFAWVYKDFTPLKIIATNLFYVIRLDDGLGENARDLICFLINNACREGGTLWAKRQGEIAKAIKLSDVKDFQVTFPPVAVRNKVMNLYSMWLIERKKTLELLVDKEKFVNAVMADVIEKES